MKFSILTASYNSYPYIKQCARSVLSQDCPSLEWIVVDDCSDDKSYKFLQSLQDSRIKLIRNKKRLFCSSAYSVALSHATGDICGIVDADDALVPFAVKKVAARYSAYPKIGYIYTQFFWCNQNFIPLRAGLSSLPKMGLSFVEMTLRFKKHCFSHWRTFRRKMGREKVLFPPGLKYAVDKALGFMLEEVGYGAFFPEKLYYYRYHKLNMSLRTGKQQKLTWREQAKRCQQLRKQYRLKVFPVIKIK